MQREETQLKNLVQMWQFFKQSLKKTLKKLKPQTQHYVEKKQFYRNVLR